MDLHAFQQFPTEHSLLLPMATPYFIPGNFKHAKDTLKAVIVAQTLLHVLQEHITDRKGKKNRHHQWMVNHMLNLKRPGNNEIPVHAWTSTEAQTEKGTEQMPHHKGV